MMVLLIRIITKKKKVHLFNWEYLSEKNDLFRQDVGQNFGLGIVSAVFKYFGIIKLLGTFQSKYL
jgi:hypothetical protein